MRHHAEHVPLAVQDTGHIPDRSITWCRIAKGDSAFGFQLIKDTIFREVISFTVGNGDPQHLAWSRGVGERRIRCLYGDLNGLANEFQAGIPEERSGQKTALAKHLEAVADAHNQTTV